MMTWILLGILLFLGLYYFSLYNSLVAARNATSQSWSNVEVELKRRFDLLGNLLQVVKGYAQHERTTLEAIVAKRASQQGFSDVQDGNKGQKEMTVALGQVMVLAEAYPSLKADTQFQNLQQELSNTENRIAERRSAYNQTVNLYLNLLETFPSNLVADFHSFQRKEYFDAPDEATELPKVSLTPT